MWNPICQRSMEWPLYVHDMSYLKEKEEKPELYFVAKATFFITRHGYFYDILGVYGDLFTAQKEAEKIAYKLMRKDQFGLLKKMVVFKSSGGFEFNNYTPKQEEIICTGKSGACIKWENK